MLRQRHGTHKNNSVKRISLVLLGFLFLLFGSTLLFGAELARRAMEREIGRLLGVPVRIARLAFTPRQLTLHDISFQMPQAASVPLRVERIHLEGSPFSSSGLLTLTGLNLSVAGFPLQAKGRVFLRRVPGSYALNEGSLDIEHPLLRGRVELTGRLLEPIVLGWLQTANGSPHHFVGQWKVRKDSVELLQMEIQGGWFASGKLSSGSRAQLNIAGPEERIRFKAAPVGLGQMRAEWWMYRPDLSARQVTVEWSTQRERLALQARLEGTANSVKGWIHLRPPYRTNLTLQLRDFPVEELAQWFGETGSPMLSGRLGGKVWLSGPLRTLISRGDLSLREGRLGAGTFETIALRFDGKGPQLWTDSTVRTPSQKVYLGEGKVDLRRIGRPEFLSAVRWSSKDRDLQMAGWLLSLTPGASGFQMQRLSGENPLRLGLAAGVDTSVPQEPVTRGGVQVQYPLGSEESLKVKMEKEEQLLTVEHRKKF